MSDLIVSLETENFQSTKSLVQELGKEVLYYKVGLPLFVKEGPPLLEFLHKEEKKVFLDLKFYDIPSVTKRAVVEACSLGVFMLNVHALGGETFLQEVVLGREKFPNTKLIGVTLLTSYSENELKREKLLNEHETVTERVIELAQKVKKAGLDGVVASAIEAREIKKKCGHDFLVVTPGIRLSADSAQHDQKRWTTVEEALASGSDYLVVGRPILEASDRKKATQLFLAKICGY